MIDGVIDTRKYATYLSAPVAGILSASNVVSTGNSGAITLDAPTITIASGGALYADVNNAAGQNATNYTAGAITLGTGSAQTIAINGVIVGASLEASASSAINIAGVVDTRTYAGASGLQAGPLSGAVLSAGDSGPITLDAPTITIASGGALYADVNNGVGANATTYMGGDVTLGAGSAQNVVIDGEIAGATVTVAAGNAVTIGGAIKEAAVTVTSGDTITLTSGSLIETRILDPTGAYSIGDSAWVVLTAPTIAIQSGSEILAAATNNPADSANVYNNGAVTLSAAADANQPNSNITIAGIITSGIASITSDNSIIISGSIDTRLLDSTGTYSVGNSFGVGLTAPTIAIAAGAQVRAEALNATGPAPTNFTAGDITLASANVSAAANTLSGGVVTFQTGASNLTVGPDSDPNAGAAGFLSNATVAGYVAALTSSSAFALTADNTPGADSALTIDFGGVVDGAGRNVALGATTISLAAGAELSGGAVSLNAGVGGAINVNVAASGGAQITASTGLQLTAATVTLTTAADMLVGDAIKDSNNSAAGFIANQTIAGYVADMGGSGALQLSAASSITVDPSGIVDSRQMTSSVSTGNSVSLALTAPTIDIAAPTVDYPTGGQVLAQAVNANGTAYTPGDVTLTALGAGAGITVAGVIKGANISLTTDQQPITVAATGVLDARQLDQSGNPTGQAFHITLAAPLINIDSGASLHAGAVTFVFTENALTVGGASLSDGGTLNDNGQSGLLSNETIASYIAAMSGSAAFVLSDAGAITLNADAVINGGGANVALSAQTLNIASGAQITAGVVGFNFDQNNVIIGTSSDLNFGDPGFVTDAEIITLIGAVTGGTFSISANNSITIDPDGVIDATERNVSTGISKANALNVMLSAPTIMIDGGGEILAQAVNSPGGAYTNGNVTLEATASDSEIIKPASATTGITIAGEVSGAAISATASATASNDYANSAEGYIYQIAANLLSGFTGLNGGYVAASATAKVTVTSTANIQASGAVTLSSIGSETAADSIFSSASIVSPVSAGVVVGQVSGAVRTEIQSGATISSGGALSVTASNSADLDVSAQTYTFKGASVDAVVAVSTGSVSTSAIIDSGANIANAASVIVAAENANSFTTSATALAGGSAQAGVTFAYSNPSTSASAQMGAAIAAGTVPGGLTVYAGSNTTSDSVQAQTTVGSDFAEVGTSQVVQALTSPSLLIFSAAGLLAGTGEGAASEQQGTSSIVPKGGASVALNLGSQSSSASIASTDGGTAPTIIDTAGDVAVVSLLLDSGVRADAATTINSNAYNPDPSDPQASKSLSVAISVAELSHTSNAYIGSGFSLTAGHVGVEAQTAMPITDTWTDFDTYSDVTSHLADDLGVSNDILTSYADATASSSKLGVAGAVNYFSVSNSTTAWIASGVDLTQTDVGADTPWTSNVNVPGWAEASVAWSAGTVVSATTTTQSIDVAGDFSWLAFFGSNSSNAQGSKPGTAVGGSANVDLFSSDTIAGIGAGAIVTADGGLDVAATTQDLVYGVAPISGKGAGFGLNGIASILQIDNTTSASISDQAQIAAPNVTIDGEQDLSMFDVAGGVGASKGTGIGIVVSVALVDASTSAFIGDNSTALSSSGADADDAGVAASAPGFDDVADLLSVSALSVGRLTTVSVAAQYNNDSAPTAAPAPIQSTSPDDAGYLSSAFGFVSAKFSQAKQRATTALNNATSSSQNLVKGANSISGAGSTSIAITSIGTYASITGANIEQAADNDVSVQALNNTIIDTASGATAIAKGAPGTNYSVGIAGAVALGISTDTTTATIENSAVDAAQVAVQALAGGENTVIGLAISATTGQATKAVSVSASVSVAEINDGVNALIDSSVLRGTGPSSSIAIDADQDAEIGIGAGSLYLKLGNGAGGGLGVALTYAEIGDPSGGDAVSAILSNSSVADIGSLSLLALDQSRILSGAAVFGGGPDADGFAGAVIVNTIGPSDLAEIVGAPAVSGTAAVTSGITVSGDVTVVASGGSSPTLEGIISTAALNANGGLSNGSIQDDSGLDFTAAVVDPTSTTGAAIIAVAGEVQAGASNLGLSLIVNQIDQSHDALIDGVTIISTGGVVNVSAVENSEILGIAFGLGGANGALAGLGSIVYNSIDDGVVAQIGDANTSAGAYAATVKAAAISVVADEDSTIRGATGAVAENLQGGTAVGLSVTIDQISNFVSAGIVGSKVSADEAESDSSTLIGGPLQAGSVVVSGQSDADILTIAIGVAISAGKSEPGQPSPEENLTALVSTLAPAAPAAGDAAAPAAPAAPPPAPSTPSSGLAGAGSVAVSTEATTVYSEITNGANSVASTVVAQDNVLVLAANSDSISAGAGALSISSSAGIGIGLSIVVNEISGATTAEVEQSIVDAHALGAPAFVDSGVLPSFVNPSDVVTPGDDPNLADGVESLGGIAIIATSRQTADTVSAIYALSTAAGAGSISSITNVMGGDTAAYADSSSLDANLLTGEASAVQVVASSASFANVLDIGIADSGGSAAGALTLVVDTMDRATKAYVTTTNIGAAAVAAGAVIVSANAWEGTSGEAIGAAGSDGFGIAGSSLVNLFDADTEAMLDHGTIDAALLAVTAVGTDGYFGAIGTGALGGTAGVGASILVAMSETTTKATIGDADAADETGAGATTINLSGPVDVSATTTTDATSYVVGVSVGGTGGGAAQFSGLFASNTAAAALENSTVTIAAAAAANGSVSVDSLENVDFNPVAGGLAIGGTGGVGASVDLVMLASDNSALIAGSSINAPGSVSVDAQSEREISSYAATAAIGGQGSFAATVGVVLIGSGASSDAMSVLDQGGTLESADQATSSGATDLTSEVAGGVDGISAEIVDSNVTASDINIAATGQMAVLNIAGSLSIGIGIGGIGAGVGYTDVDQDITAQAIGGVLVTPTLTIDATAQDDGGGHAARTIAAAGAGGLYVGLGAAVADSIVDNNVQASLGSTVNDGALVTTTAPPTIFSTSISVTSSDSSSVRADAYGFAGGAAAVGISVALAKRDSVVTSDVLAPANLASASVIDQASDSGETWAYALGGAGGVYAGDGAVATAADNATVTAELMSGAAVVAGDTQVLAADTPDAKGFAFGVAVGYAAVGASVALVTADPTVTAAVDDGVVFQRTDQVGAVGSTQPVVTYGGSLEVTAQSLIGGNPATDFPATNTLPASTDNFADGGTTAAGWAIAGAGGALIGAQGTYVETDGDATVLARIGSIPAAGAPPATGLSLPMGDVSLTATNDTDQFSRSTGVSVGYVALGVELAYANADTTTQAVLGNNVATPFTVATSDGDTTDEFLARGGTLTISATGVDTVVADAQAGAGGVVAGSGAEAHTSDTSNLSSEIGANAFVVAGAVTITATHTDDYAADVDSLSASAVGASASIAVNDADSAVAITLGAGVTIQSSDVVDSTGTVTTANAVSLTASNNFSDDFAGSPTDSIKAAGGGGINGFGASSTTNLTGSSSVTIGSEDSVTAGTGGVIVLALSNVSDQNDTISLDTGGAIEGAGVGDYVTANLTNAVSVGDSTDQSLEAHIASQGVVVLATYASGAIDTSGLVHTYGLAGVGEADAASILNVNQSVNVADAFIIGIGEIDITAGLNPLGTSFGQTSLSVDANAESYVYGLIAIPHTDATTNVTSNASVDIDPLAIIGSGASVVLGAYHGAPVSNANGTGHGYELGFIPADQGGSNPGQPVTSASVTLDGDVTAGIYHDQEIDITCNPCTATGSPTFTLVSGAPVLVEGAMPETLSAGQIYSYAPGETNVWQFVSDNFDAEVAPVLKTGVSFQGQTTQTYILGQLYAAGGVVQINADTIAGKGTATSWGNPTITINNDSAATIILAGGAYIPDTPSGEFIFTGAASQADALAAGVKLSVQSEHPTSGVTVDMNYTGTAENSNFGPTFINQGPISALGGAVSLYNANGWFGQIGDIISSGVTETAPYGGLVVSSTAAGQTFSAADVPYADWLTYENFPGAANSTTVAGLFFPDSGQGGSGAFATTVLMNAAANTFVDFVANLWVAQVNPQRYVDPTSNTTSAVFNTSDSSDFNIQLYGIASRSTQGESAYGIFGSGNDLQIGAGVANDPLTTAYEFFSSCTYINCGYGTYSLATNLNEPVVPVVYVPSASTAALTIFNLPGRATAANGFLLTSNNFSDTGVTQSSAKIFGGPVAIKASIIDINGPIVSGIANDWSLTINSGAISADQASYQSTGVQTYTLSTASATTIGATYDAKSNVVTVANITASSGAGYVLLDGEIISTTALQNGSITVNGGLGQVTINNPTSAALVINDVANGSTVGGQPLQSRIKIVDTLKDQVGEIATDTTTYLFTPGVGVATYVTGYGQDPAANAVPNSNSTISAGLSYSPVIGARYQWDQTAYLASEPDPNNSGGLVWTFTDPSGTPLSISEPSTSNPWFLNSVSVTTGNSSTMPLFQETMSATVNFTPTIYHFGCDDGGVLCNYGFYRIPGSNSDSIGVDGGNDGFYQFDVAQSVSLTLVNSVKADNPIGINFSGNATGFLNVISVGGVTFAGNVGNASGLTSVTTTGAGSNIIEAANATLSTQSLLLSTAGAIGSAAQSFGATMTVGQSGAPAGAVQAAAGTGGVNLAFTSAVAIDSVVSSAKVGGVTTYGDVTISALGNLVASTAATHVDGTSIAAGSANITGRNISLSSLTGSVGSGSGTTAAPLVISANTTIGANSELLDGVINVAAIGDIALTGITGDFRIGQIASASGDVTINVPNGVILNASGLTSSDALSAAQLSAIETRLNLTNPNAALTETVAPFEKAVDAAYIAYEALLANATVSGANLTLTAAGLQLYAQAAGTAQLGAYNTLLGFGSVVNGTFTLNTAGVQYYTKAAIASLGTTQASAFSALLANGTVASSGSFSLSAAGLTAYAAAAAAADNVATATNAQIQAYAAGLYNGLTQQVQTYAAAQAAALTGALFTGPAAANAIAYETLLANGTLGANGTFTLSATGLTYYAAAAAAADHVATATSAQIQAYASNLLTSVQPMPNPTAAAIQAYATAQYAGYVSTFEEAFATAADPNGVDWQSALAALPTTNVGNTPTINYQVAANSQLYTDLTQRAVWQDGQFVQAIDQSALEPAQTIVGNAPASLIGYNIFINASNGVGEASAPVTIAGADLAALKNGTLTDPDQIAALASATTPGSVTVTYDSTGQNVVSINLAEVQPLYVSATGSVSATSKYGEILLQATGSSGLAGSDTLRVGAISAAGAVSLTAPVSILEGAAPALPSIVSGGALTLAAGTGDLGAFSAPLTFQAPVLNDASAAGSVWLESVGDAVVGRIFADPNSGTASLTAVAGATPGNISEYYSSGLAITASSIILTSSDNIGSSATPFAVGDPSATSGGFTVSGSAVGSTYLTTEAVDSVAATMIVNHFAAGGVLNVVLPTVDVNNLDALLSIGLEFEDVSSSKTGSVVAEGGIITMMSGSAIDAIGPIDLTADSGSITLGQLVSGLSASASTPAIVVTANHGAIVSNGDGRTNLVAPNSHADVTLTAQSDIGASTQALSVETTLLSATTTQGGLYLNAVTTLPAVPAFLTLSPAPTLEATQLSAAEGSIDITGTANLQLDSVNAGVGFAAQSSGYIAGNPSAATIISETVALTAGGDIGSSANPFSFDATGAVSGSAGGSAWLTSTESVNVATFAGAHGVLINSNGALRIETVSNPVTLDGLVSSADGPVTLRGQSVTMDQGAGVTADGAIVISSATDVTIGQVTSSATGSAIDIEAGAASFGAPVVPGVGNIAGNAAAAGLTDVTAGAGALLNAGAAIGPIAVDIANLSATADTGDLSLTQMAALHASVLSAPHGAIDVEGASALTLDDVTAGAAFTAKSTAGAITLGSATSGGTQTIVANSDLLFTTLTTTGAPGDTGSIDLTSTLGAVQGQPTGASLIASNGDVTISGASVQLDTVTANGKASVDALTTLAGTSLTTGGDASLAAGVSTNLTPTLPVSLSWTTVKAGTTFEAQAYGGTIATLGAVTSGGTQTIGATGDIGFTTLTTTAGHGGDADVTSTAGSITGGSVFADGSASLTSATSNDGATVTATTGSVTLAAGSLLSPSALASIGWTNVNAGMSLTATSGGGLTLADVSTGTTGAGGNQTIHGSGAVDVTTTLATAGAIGVKSDASTVTIGSATSGGTQTIEAYLGLGYTTLKTTAGDIDLTSDAASITGAANGDTLDAKGSFDLVAVTTISGTSLKAETGSGSVTAGGAIDLGSTNIATTLGVTSTGDAVTIGSATSGGTQTIEANNDLLFTTLTTTGAPGDAGSIDLTSTLGAVQGQPTGASLIASNADVTISGASVQLDTVTANGKASIDALTTLAGTSLTTGGDASLVAGVSTNLTPTLPVSLSWTNVKAGTTFEAQAYGGTIATLGSVTSGGTQTIGATGDIGFTTLLVRGGDIDVTGATVTGATLTAQTGAAMLTSTGTSDASIDVSTVSVATAFEATATAGGMTLGSATSGGMQTIVANNDLLFTTLKTTGAGSIDLTSTLGAVQGQPTGASLIASNADVTISGLSVQLDTVTATGKASIDAMTTLVGTNLTTSGDASLTAGVSTNLTPTIPVSLSWTNLNVGTTFEARAYGGTIATLGSATSDGTQTIGATGDIGFTTLLANAGDIDVTSTGGSIAGGSVSANGSASLTSVTSNDGATVTATAGNVTLAVGSLSSPSALASIGWTNVNAGTSLTATSGGRLTLADVSTGTTGAGGAQTIHGSGAVDVTTTSATAGPIGVTSDASGVRIGSAISGGTETIEAYLGLDYTTLKTTGIAGGDVGDIKLTSDTASITGNATGDTLDANGSFILDAATAINAISLMAETGAGFVKSGGAIGLGSATSQGTQTIEATDAIGFTMLRSKAGDVDVMSDTASIAGGSVFAVGSASLTSATSNDGITVTATTGSATLAAGSLSSPSSSASIGWMNVNAGTLLTAASGGELTLADVSTGTTGAGGNQTIHGSGAVDVTTTLAAAGTIGMKSDASTVTIGSATSDGTETIEAYLGLGYSTLKTNGMTGDVGDIKLTSDTASITGNAPGDTLDANGSFILNAAMAINATSLTAATGSGFAEAGGAIDLGTTNIATTLGVTSTSDAVTLGSATSGGRQMIEADKALTYTTLKTTAGDIDLTSNTASITGKPSGDLLDAKGSFTLMAATTISGTSLKAETGSGLAKAAGAIDLGATNIATALGVTSTGAGITLGSATSGGTQTIEANNDLLFTRLTTTGAPGDASSIDLTSTLGAVQGQPTGASLIESNADVTISGASVQLDMVTANGNASMDALTTLAGTSLTTGRGASLVAGVSTNLTPTLPVSLSWANVNAGTTFEAQAYGGTIASLGSVTSGGTQTIGATGSVLLTQLTTTSGDVDVTSDTGSITGGSIAAQRSATLTAALNNTGDQLTTTTGAATLTAGGLIDWNNVDAATTIKAHSTGGAVTFGATQSGGTQNLIAAGEVTFVKLVTTGVSGDEGDVDIVAGSAIHGGEVDANGALNAIADGMTFGDIDAKAGVSLESSSFIAAGDVTTLGSFEVDSAGALSLGNISASNLIFSSAGSPTFGDLTVSSGISLAATDIDIGLLRQSPGATGPLDVSLTGYNGGIGNSATLTIVAPNGVVIPELRERSATISTDASLVAINSAMIVDTLDLTTSHDNIWVNDQSSRPANGADVQLFQPGYAFYLTQNGTSTATNAFVVQYGDNSAIVDQLSGNIYLGASFARDFDRQGWSGDSEMLSVEGGADNPNGWQFPIEAFDLHLQRLFGEGIMLAQPGQPAVNMGDSGSATELVSDGLGFTIIVRRRH
ncbi:hypothetical protein [Methylocapsa sp. S129]|uniref:hypothetical protein n=1 Tax=Methylocapsa sp. S129 TaxID=1641869 RepID=UPI001AEED94A|nr:hypothetical protein [Methylocapsa sp. S129]